MENVLIAVVLLVIVGSIVWYIWRERKHGAKCIGCPYAKQCGGKCDGSCGHVTTDQKHHQ